MDKFRLSIRTKLAALVLALILAAIISVGGILYWHSREILKERIFSDLSAFLATNESQLLSMLQHDFDLVDLVASRRLPREHLLKIISREPDLGRYEADTQKTLRDAMSSASVIERIDVIDLDGNIIGSTSVQEIGRNISTSEAFRQGKTSRYFSGFQPSAGNVMFEVAIPLANPTEGKKDMVGVLHVRIRADNIYKLLDEAGRSFGGGMLLGKTAGADILFLNTLPGIPGSAFKYRIPLDSKLAEPMRLALKKGNGMVEGLDSNGDRVLAAYRYIPFGDWGLVARISTSEAFKPINMMLKYTLAVLLAVIIVSSIAVFFFSKYITAPIKDLHDGTARISSGDLGYRLPIRSYDEIGLLSQAFNEMADSLRKITASRDELDKEITERRRVEVQLREQSEHMRAITDSAQDAILMMDPEGRISYWNPAAERIFGYTSSEAIGRNLHDLLVPARYLSAHHGAFPEFQKTGHGAAIGKTLELEAIRKGGQEISVQLSLSAVKMESGWHAVGILRDITGRKLAEERLIETNRQLEAATARAEAANVAKSEFLANMSHEIRTPMNGVLGMISILLDSDLDTDQRKYAETIRLSAESLLTIINDILDFSKIEAGKLELDETDFDLGILMENVMDILAVRAQEKGLELNCLVNPGIPCALHGDHTRLKQILINLVGNSMKFTLKGEIFVSVELKKDEDDRILLYFEVRDTGIGIPAGKIDSLFSAFTQVDSSTTRKFGGTGLGLSISKRLAEKMGGAIGVISEEGKGSTFWFTIQLKKQAGKTGAEKEIPESFRDVRMLTVDDNATNRLVMRTLLSSWNFKHDEVEDASSALAAIHGAKKAGSPYHIAFLDMLMPDIDGESLAREIRKDPGISGTILVMMSSAGPAIEKKFRDSGLFDAYFPKPIRKSHLFDCIANLLGEKRLSEDIPAESGASILKAKTAKILLVEDNEINQKVACAILAKLGFSPDLAGNGAEAVKALETKAYDLVLMDVQMPVMDGFEATRMIRDRSSGVLDHDIRIIAMTAHALKDDREKCLEAGMNDYVSKPVNPEELAKAISRQLSGGKATFGTDTAIRRKKGNRGINPDIFNINTLMERVFDDNDLLNELIELFLKDAPGLVTSLKDSFRAGDLKKVQNTAHTIKGMAGNFSAESLQKTSLALEQACKAGDPVKAGLLIDTVEMEFELLKKEILKLKSSTKQGAG